MTRPPKLDAATLRSVARELRQSAKAWRAWERQSAKGKHWLSAAEERAVAAQMERWTEHFEGQADAAQAK